MNSTSTISLLATHDWRGHIPEPENLYKSQSSESKSLTIEEELSALQKISSIVKEAIKLNGEDSNIKTVIHKCCEFATLLPTGPAVLKACKICEELLSTGQSLEADQELLKPLTFVFDDGKEIHLPNYYKYVLARESGQLDAMLTSKFREASSPRIPMREINSSHFAILLKFIQGDTINLFLPFKLDETFEICKLAQFLMIKDFNFSDLLAQKFQQDVTVINQESFKRAVQLHSDLVYLGIPIDKSLQSTLGAFYGEYLLSRFLQLDPAGFAEAISLLNNVNLAMLKLPKSVPDGFLEHLREIKSLKALDLNHSKITNTGLESIGKLNLDYLNLSNCLQCNNEGFASLKNVPLKTLVLNGCTFLNEIGLSHIAAIPSLTSLNLTRCPVNNAMLAIIKDKPLNSLNLTFCSKINNEGLVLLKDMPLRTLILTSCGVTSTGLVHLKKMPLEHLNLQNCKSFTDHGLIHLHGIPLHSLILSGTRVTEAGVLLFKSSNPKVNVEY